MYSISDLLEIGSVRELVMSTKVHAALDDVAFPSDFASEQFDE